MNPHAPREARTEGQLGSVLDAAAFGQVLALDDPDDPGFVRMVVGKFRDTSTADVQTMKQLAASGDDAQLKATSHRMKSATLQMGATQLSTLCAQIEADARDRAPGDRTAQVAAIEAALDRVLIALDVELGKLG